MKFRFVFSFFAVALLGQVHADQSLNGVSLDEYLKEQGEWKFLEGHVYYGGTNQPEFFVDLLNEHPEIRVIGEVGFHAGHSSDLFLGMRKDIIVYSFDIDRYPFLKHGKKYIDLKYPKRHTLTRGNSIFAIPRFFYQKNRPTFDLIFIDGGHRGQVPLHDIINMRYLANKNTIVVIDDYSYPDVKKAVDHCVKNKLIAVEESFKSKHKVWAKCKYLFD